MIQTEVGAIINRQGKELVVCPVNKNGFALFGPYLKLPAGRYTVTFNVSANSECIYDLHVCGRADVAIERGARIVAQTALYMPRIQINSEINLFFELAAPAEVEFRVYTTGKIPLVVDPSPILMKAVDKKAYFCPIFPLDQQPKHEFMIRNFGDFRFLYENGAEVSEDEFVCVVNIAGV